VGGAVSSTSLGEMHPQFLRSEVTPQLSLAHLVCLKSVLAGESHLESCSSVIQGISGDNPSVNIRRTKISTSICRCVLV
jgi:hypothetical protein